MADLVAGIEIAHEELIRPSASADGALRANQLQSNKISIAEQLGEALLCLGVCLKSELYVIVTQHY